MCDGAKVIAGVTLCLLFLLRLIAGNCVDGGDGNNEKKSCTHGIASLELICLFSQTTVTFFGRCYCIVFMFSVEYMSEYCMTQLG